VTILVNGEQREVPPRTTVAVLLRMLGLPEGRIAVERNREVVPRSLHEELQLSEGDRLELVRFVGGG
jgi:thiamine biosynthesis protein ThiS